MPMLRPRNAAIWSSLLPLSSSPAIRTVPESTLSRPASTISSVDLPEPDGPTMPVASPVATSRLTPFSTCTDDAPFAERQRHVFQLR